MYTVLRYLGTAYPSTGTVVASNLYMCSCDTVSMKTPHLLRPLLMVQLLNSCWLASVIDRDGAVHGAVTQCPGGVARRAVYATWTWAIITNWETGVSHSIQIFRNIFLPIFFLFN
jgi:hypothetical protein